MSTSFSNPHLFQAGAADEQRRDVLRILVLLDLVGPQTTLSLAMAEKQRVHIS